jgi:pyridoxamine 5'-phosphate oxidase-like protein
MPVDVSTHFESFFEEVMPVTVGTVRRNGSVRMNAAWFEYRDRFFWLNSWRGSKWLDAIERNRTATLFLIDPANMFRTAEVTTALVETTTEGATEHIERLSQRYTGGPYRSRQEQQRVIIQLDPLTVRGSIDMFAQMAAAGNAPGAARREQ